uniref:Uncharacterized protein n=1 Tax=Melopsittacus undulatus TaxID=13146 RepID=A0A8C6K444_MELUD
MDSVATQITVCCENVLSCCITDMTSALPGILIHFLIQALVHFLAIPKQPIIKLLEAESSDESPFWHLLTAGKKYAVNEGPQGRQAVCYLHLPLLSSCQQESLSA